MQKIAYLCKVLGISISYDFGLYLNGPYSLDLTRAYYKYSERVVNKKSAYTPSDKEKKIYELIKNEILSDSETEDHLEIS